MGETYNLLESLRDDGGLEFALEAPKGIVKRNGQGGKPRPTEPPEQLIREMRALADGDPHVGEAVNTYVDFLVGSGFTIKPTNIPYTDTEQTDEDIADLKALIQSSRFETVLFEWVWHALVDGTAFIEIVWDQELGFKPRLLPTERVLIQTDEYGEVTGYEFSADGQKDNIPYDPHDLAMLRFHTHPGEDYGMSLLELSREQTEMLRDMEFDLARFVATKAYPPILWKLGTDDVRYTTDQINEWLDEVEAVEPDSVLAAGTDVDFDVVGTTSTSSQGGVLNLEGTFQHLEERIMTGLGLPAELLNVPLDSSNGGTLARMPKFDRRIKRYQAIIKSAIENQIFRSVLGHPDPENYTELLPTLDFNEHSSDEERLDVEEQIKHFTMGFLSREAYARRVGIDPEVEMPTDEELQNDIIPLLQDLSGKGDEIANPDGGRPTDTGTGSDSAGREAKTREAETKETGDSRKTRPKKSVTQE